MGQRDGVHEQGERRHAEGTGDGYDHDYHHHLMTIRDDHAYEGNKSAA